MRPVTLIAAVLIVATFNPDVRSQEPAAPAADAAPKIPEIKDEPRTIDPAAHVPEKLAAKVTVDFAETSLRDVAAWIEREEQMPVRFDAREFETAGILQSDTVTDRLADEPLYLLLNRLASIGVAWYIEEDVLHLSTVDAARSRETTKPYNVGDLLDAGFEVEKLRAAIQDGIEAQWEAEDGEGGVFEWLGDVVFIRQTDRKHREIAGLLAALRDPARLTYAYDPPQHLVLREKLDQNITVDFRDKPLAAAIAELASLSQADLRLDVRSLDKAGVRARTPISLSLSDRKLGTALQILLSELELTWMLRDGVIWITTAGEAKSQFKTAVFDVRDLCRNDAESDALQSAVESQSSARWTGDDGEGGAAVFAKAGILVVLQTDPALQEIFSLLERYRQALRESKPRQRTKGGPDEIITQYYRVDAQIAQDLLTLLPQLISPETWQNNQHPDAPGTLTKVASKPELIDSQGVVPFGTDSDKSRAGRGVIVQDQAVLIVKQKRSVHDEIAELIQRIEYGNANEVGAFGGGGGFGGGFFSAPEQRPAKPAPAQK